MPIARQVRIRAAKETLEEVSPDTLGDAGPFCGSRDLKRCWKKRAAQLTPREVCYSPKLVAEYAHVSRNVAAKSNLGGR